MRVPRFAASLRASYRRRKSADTGVRFNDAKAKCFSPSGRYGDRPEIYTVATATTADGEQGGGLKLWGCGLGQSAYVRALVEQKGALVQGLVNKISSRLGPVNPDCLTQVLSLSSNHMFDWVLQMHHPSLTAGVGTTSAGSIGRPY